jgi:hypothetical protein
VKNKLIPGILMACLAMAFSPANALNLGELLNKEIIHKSDNGSPQKASMVADTVPPATVTSTSASLQGFSNKDQVGSLKQALTQGAEMAVTSLAKENGFLGNEKVRIPLPDSLNKTDKLLRQFGLGRYADELITAMNRAAEAAVPEARNLLVSAVKNMSVADARSILTGGNDAATQYFRTNTEVALSNKFSPIVNQSMQKVKLAEKYDLFASKGAKFGLVDQRDTRLGDYVTRKTLEGLFQMMAEQEKAIRENPLQATGSLARKIFSAIKM